MDDDIDRPQDLTDHGGPTEPSQCAKGHQTSWYVAGRVRVYGRCAALVTGVQCDEQLGHLGAAELADNQPIRTHPQRLPDQLPQTNRALALHIRRPRDQPDDVRMVDLELGGVFDDYQP